MGKAVIAVSLLAVLTAAAWKTMEPGSLRWVVVVILSSFVLRIVLGVMRGQGGSQ